MDFKALLFLTANDTLIIVGSTIFTSLEWFKNHENMHNLGVLRIDAVKEGIIKVTLGTFKIVGGK